jgi:predicted oxidoreductase
MKVWITKYALTDGIIVADVEVDRLGGVATVTWSPVTGGEHFHGRDWHTTLEGALDRVKQMIDTKRKSLAKQTAQLEEFAKSGWATKVSTVEEVTR